MERAVAVAVAKRSVLHDISDLEQRCIGRYGFDYPHDDNGNPAPFLFVLTREMTDLVEEEEERIKEKNVADYQATAEAASEAAKETARTAAREAPQKTRRGRRKRPSQGALAH
jgi:hypothetical protein